jgi:hypothetical protein
MRIEIQKLVRRSEKVEQLTGHFRFAFQHQTVPSFWDSRIFHLPTSRQVRIVFAILGAQNTQQTIYKHVFAHYDQPITNVNILWENSSKIKKAKSLM